VRYRDVQQELDTRKETLDNVTYGLSRFVFGLAKKILLANRCGALLAQIQGQELSMSLAWLGAILFAFQIYFDFSGYSDMAIGLGRIFGFRFLENFNDPYAAASVTDFWRRWHISLGTWFREYVYIPLGGNRCGLGRQLINLSVVWLLTGLWHGASWNFVLWGVFFGVLLVFEKCFMLKVLKGIPTVFGRIYMLFAVLISWVIFMNEDMAALGQWLKAMFIPGTIWCSQTTYLLETHALLLVLCVFFCTTLPRGLHRCVERHPILAQRVSLVAVPALLIISMIFLVAETYNPFLYFRF
jgi:alginate O-acetyltransferase complex protein AlgI